MFFDASYIRPSSLLVSSNQISIDWIVHLLLCTLLNPLGVWVYAVPMYLRMNDRKYLRFGSYVVICWVLRYLNLRSKRCKYPRRKHMNVIITGGSHGLGLEIVRRICDSATVFVLDQEKSAQLEPLLASTKNVQFLQCNVADQKSLQTALNAIFGSVDRLDAVICNAGVRQTKQTLHLQPSELRELFDINYFANVQLIQHAIKHHRHPNRLHLVCVSSVLGFVSPRGLSGYSATKAGLHTFFMALRHEVPDSVVISTILPGQLTTRMFEDVRVDRYFWAPLVDHCKLAQRVVELIERGENGFFAFPLYARFIPILQVLPYSWYRALKKFSRMDDVIEDK
ncbi:hypothetical protein KL905_001524 [Ogataea polymorpha]|nr:hypothetical protein KL908_000519 [Ogataea polymorpha]KAG7912317.1 hypothetical protein KL906_000521 [Ogataea polymorpha]KAG7919921.1 hypothetical protein KL927_000601 [Ogataea polymorpha]KAG7923258.1 hypothetical protein KL905_001524 [Ogataea polymorpha]KAG7938029.1 hypothetical protein KL934_000603 [Ogataea polymorpha]